MLEIDSKMYTTPNGALVCGNTAGLFRHSAKELDEDRKWKTEFPITSLFMTLRKGMDEAGTLPRIGDLSDLRCDWYTLYYECLRVLEGWDRKFGDDGNEDRVGRFRTLVAKWQEDPDVKEMLDATSWLDKDCKIERPTGIQTDLEWLGQGGTLEISFTGFWADMVRLAGEDVGVPDMNDRVCTTGVECRFDGADNVFPKDSGSGSVERFGTIETWDVEREAMRKRVGGWAASASEFEVPETV